jgi:radical SAM protein with 4Fe4S-binding SPASM domain
MGTARDPLLPSFSRRKLLVGWQRYRFVVCVERSCQRLAAFGYVRFGITATISTPHGITFRRTERAFQPACKRAMNRVPPSPVPNALRARLEPFGAWVQIEQPRALIAINQQKSRQLGLDGGELWEPNTAAAAAYAPAPLEVHLAVTQRCPAACPHCYMNAEPDGWEPSFSDLCERLKHLANTGVFTVAFGGGEPLTRPDIGELARVARSLGMTPVMTTSGLGLTKDRISDLKALAQINLSYDGDGTIFQGLRAYDGSQRVRQIMSWFHEQEMRFGVNLVLTRQTFPHWQITRQQAIAHGACEVQLLRLKPGGRLHKQAYLDQRMLPEQADMLASELCEAWEQQPHPLRIDCALVPFLSTVNMSPKRMKLFGIFGCEAGRHLAGLDGHGRISPCSFSPTSSLTSHELGQPSARQSERHLQMYREHHEHSSEPCSSCELRTVCRGGCRVVADLLEEPWQPDPECPRVRKAKHGALY